MGLMSAKESVRTACSFLGTPAAFARALEVKPQTVSQWLSGKRSVPPGRCPQIEKLTKGAVTRRDLRPHDYAQIWPELARKTKQAA